MANELDMSEHHRRPRSLEGKTVPKNISVVSVKKHQAWHLLFRNHPPNIIAEIINKVWLDPDFEMVVVRRKKKVRR